MLQVKIFRVNPLGTNCYVVWNDGGDRCAVVDPGLFTGAEEEMLVAWLTDQGLMPDAILLTHGHFDHTWGVASLARRYGCPVYMSAADDGILALGTGLLPGLDLGKAVEPFPYIPAPDRVQAGGCLWQVIPTPGHSPGGVCWYCAQEGVLLSGDTLFAGSIGRTDHAGGDYDVLIRSIMDGLMGLPGGTDVLPGHGGATTIAREAMQNPFLIPFNEPDDTAWWEQDGLSLDGR